MTSFFTPLTRVILSMLYLSLVSNPNEIKYLGSLAHEQTHTLTTRSINHSSNSGRLMNSKLSFVMLDPMKYALYALITY